MKIKIIKCEDKNSWYYEKIGEEFFVLKESENMGYLVKRNITIDLWIDKEDCEIIK